MLKLQKENIKVFLFQINVFLLIFIVQINIREQSPLKEALMIILLLLGSFFIKWPISKTIVKIFLFYCSLVCLHLLINERLRLSEASYAILIPGFVLACSQNKKHLPLPAYTAITIQTVYYCFNIYIGTNFNELFIGGSRNLVSVSLLSTFIFLLFSVPKNLSTFGIGLVFLFIATYSQSRSGFIAFGLIILGLFFGMNRRPKATLFLGGLILTPLTFNTFDFNYQDILEYTNVINRLNESIEGGERFAVLNCYYREFDSLSLLFGPDRFGNNHCAYLADGTGNPHNSFIKLYSGVGIFFIAFVGWILYKVTAHAIRLNFGVLFVFLGVFFRFSTDWIGFFQVYDYIFALSLLILCHGFNKSVLQNSIHHSDLLNTAQLKWRGGD